MARSAFLIVPLAVLGALVVGGCQAPSAVPPGVELSPQKNLERAVALLQTSAKDEDPTLRANSIEALQLLPGSRALDIMEQGLHDKEWVVRFAAAMAAGKRRAEALRPTLRQVGRTETDGNVRVAVVYALRRLGEPANMNLLAEGLGSPDVSVRANSAFVLGQLREPSAIALLRSRRQETDPRVKFEISAALARLGDPNAREFIISQALSKYAEDRWMALAICGDLPRDVAGNALLIGLKEPLHLQNGRREDEVRGQLIAARSLGKLGSYQGGKLALAYAKDSSPELRALAALALGEMLYVEEEPPVARLLYDADPRVQLAAAAAIVTIEARGQAQAATRPGHP